MKPRSRFATLFTMLAAVLVGTAGVAGCNNFNEEMKSFCARTGQCACDDAGTCDDGSVCKPLGAACSAATDCCVDQGLGCDVTVGKCRSRQGACFPEQYRCDSSTPCCGGVCSAGVCGKPCSTFAGAPCMDSRDCCLGAGLACDKSISVSMGTCAAATAGAYFDGFSCSFDDLCASGYCDGLSASAEGRCGAPPACTTRAALTSCDVTTCCGGRGYQCRNPSACCLRSGESCAVSTYCCSNTCSAGKCT